MKLVDINYTGWQRGPPPDHEDEFSQIVWVFRDDTGKDHYFVMRVRKGMALRSVALAMSDAKMTLTDGPVYELEDSPS